MDDIYPEPSEERSLLSSDVARPSLDNAMQEMLRPMYELLHRIDTRLNERAALDAIPINSGREVTQDQSHPAWQRMFLGEELCGVPALASTRDQFLQDVVGGVDAARAFAAQMMLIQSATVDQMPELLKQVGEAYYRWRPRTSPLEDAFEKALAQCLTRRAESAGLRNSIQLVRPGDRFESSRHLTEGRGVEIVAVHGWVVLRDGNKVYTRANVSVR